MPGNAGSFSFTVQATAAKQLQRDRVVHGRDRALDADGPSPTLRHLRIGVVGGAGDRTVTLTNNSASTIALSSDYMVGALTPASSRLGAGRHHTARRREHDAAGVVPADYNRREDGDAEHHQQTVRRLRAGHPHRRRDSVLPASARRS
jgi:hypothetical protein